MNALDDPSARSDFTIRPARESDAGALIEMIRELAEYERLLDARRGDEKGFAAIAVWRASLRRGDHRRIGRRTGGVRVVFFNIFNVRRPAGHLSRRSLRAARISMPRNRPRFVSARCRGKRSERNCGRLEWSVLDWNEPAMRFIAAWARCP